MLESEEGIVDERPSQKRQLQFREGCAGTAAGASGRHDTDRAQDPVSLSFSSVKIILPAGVCRTLVATTFASSPIFFLPC